MADQTAEFTINSAFNASGPFTGGPDNLGGYGWYDGTFNSGATCGSAVTNPPQVNGITIINVCQEFNSFTPINTFAVSVVGTQQATIFDTVAWTDSNGEPQQFQFAAATIDTSHSGYTIFTWLLDSDSITLPINQEVTFDFSFVVPPPSPAEEQFNCDCTLFSTSGIELQTLNELRYRMMVRLGYAASANNPPPGMNDLLYEFLYNSQVMLYKNHRELHTERFFKWTMVPGVRFYGIAANDNDDTADCFYTIDPYKVSWVGFEDLNQAWYELQAGIDPILYTRVQISTGWPTNYEIRQCVEIFPAPKSAYTLWLKGHIGLLPFPNDSSDPQTTIDSEAVFLLALANAKSHYGQRDAQSVASQAGAYVRDLVAGTHLTRKYVPRTRVANPATPPKFLPLDT